MEEKNFDLKSFIGFALIGGILLYMMSQNKSIPDEIVEKQQQKAQFEDLNMPNNLEEFDNETVFSQQNSKLGMFKYSSEANFETDNITVIENKFLKLKINNKGGMLEEVKLKAFVNHDSLPIFLIKDGNSQFNLNFTTSDNRSLNTKDLYFEPTLNNQGDLQILSMKLKVSDDKFLEYRYSLNSEDYMVGFLIKSKGLNDVFDNSKVPEFEWNLKALRQDQSITFENRYTRLNYEHEVDKTNKLSQSGDDEDEIEDVSWISYRQHFFSSILVSEKPIDIAKVYSYDLVDDETIDTTFTKKYITKFPLVYDSGELLKDMNFYFGPTYAETLKKYNRNLENSIPFGWGIFGWINKAVFSPLYSWLSSFLSYGIAIIVMTIMVKILLSFVQYKQFLSQAKMKILKPELDALRLKYKNNKAKAQRETMALQNKAGASPLSGCLPGILQIPVFYSLFMFFPIAFELRQKPFLWVKDLSSYDTIVDLPFSIPFYGDHISLFPILASIAIFFYMKMTTGQNMSMQPAQEGMPDMAKMMKYMIYFSPLLMLFFFNNYASGLSLYYFVSNLISIGIMLVIKNYIIDEEKVLAKIQVNKAKPKKQNRFQRKMAEIMEQAEKQKALQERRRK